MSPLKPSLCVNTRHLKTPHNAGWLAQGIPGIYRDKIPVDKILPETPKHQSPLAGAGREGKQLERCVRTGGGAFLSSLNPQTN